MAFEPIHDDHGIALVSIVITLQDKLEGDFDTIAKAIMNNDEKLKFFTPMFSQKSKFAENKISMGEPEKVGFMVSDDPKNPTVTWRGVNEENRNVLIYATNAYDRWQPFFRQFSKTFTHTLNLLANKRLFAIGLEYVDQFTWTGDVKSFTWKNLFKSNTKMLPKDFFDHTHLRFSVLRNRSLAKSENVTEELEILRLNTYVTRIKHHVSLLLNPEDLKPEPDFDNCLATIENLHVFNKDVLKQLLTDKMVQRVGLNKAPSK